MTAPLWTSLRDRIFDGEPESASPENALDEQTMSMMDDDDGR
ncbi:hypothetical protein [Rhodoplanes serenus]|nr:hypothetical protein [Rhodoplanes serenus]